TTDVEHPPRIAGGAPDLGQLPADHQPPGGGAGLVLGREVEGLVVPRDHDVQRLVAWWEGDVHVELPDPTVSLGPPSRQVGTGVVLGDGHVEAVPVDDE